MHASNASKSAQINTTATRFGHPHTLIAETEHWTVLVRPQQPTLGSLVLVCKDPVQRFGQASPAAFADLQPVVAEAERVLQAWVGFERINYLMLMMVDPDVHVHVIPRYQGSRTFEGSEFPDAGWPGPPALGEAVTPDSATLQRVIDELRGLWTATGDGL
jgi:diadenosine tetraphosphate (Ap4A) HIT family hydrolase